MALIAPMTDLTPAGFMAMVDAPDIDLAPEMLARLTEEFGIVQRLAGSDTPIYGLNTGLGAKHDQRVPLQDLPQHHIQIIRARAVATGDPMPPWVGRGVLIARLLGAAKGGSGLSPAIVHHLRNLFNAGLAPVIPSHGSLGASDLTQTAVWALACLGEGQFWAGTDRRDAQVALTEARLTVPGLGPRDAMGLASQTGLTTALSADALHRVDTALAAARTANLLSYAAYDANRTILTQAVNALRPDPAQAREANWLLDRLGGTNHAPRHIQEALSFRLAAVTLGAASGAWDDAVQHWRTEAGHMTDSPALIDGALISTPNFAAPALALSLERVSLSLPMLGQAALQRAQKLMTPGLSNLPRALAPDGGATAGLVPVQKTMAALWAALRREAMPVAFDPPPVSETVEDMAPMTPLVAQKLAHQAELLVELCAAEALVAWQGIRLGPERQLSEPVRTLCDALSEGLSDPESDRPLTRDLSLARAILTKCAASV